MTQQKLKVLAIDDTPTNLMMLGRALAADFDLQIATSGAKGLALATEAPPDPVSYTHLDVYKRQGAHSTRHGPGGDRPDAVAHSDLAKTGWSG